MSARKVIDKMPEKGARERERIKGNMRTKRWIKIVPTPNFQGIWFRLMW